MFSIAVLPHSPGVVYYHVLLRRHKRKEVKSTRDLAPTDDTGHLAPGKGMNPASTHGQLRDHPPALMHGLENRSDKRALWLYLCGPLSCYFSVGFAWFKWSCFCAHRVKPKLSEGGSSLCIYTVQLFVARLFSRAVLLGKCHIHTMQYS